jgi:hypothetical protein
MVVSIVLKKTYGNRYVDLLTPVPPTPKKEDKIMLIIFNFMKKQIKSTA